MSYNKEIQKKQDNNKVSYCLYCGSKYKAEEGYPEDHPICCSADCYYNLLDDSYDE